MPVPWLLHISPVSISEHQVTHTYSEINHLKHVVNVLLVRDEMGHCIKPRWHDRNGWTRVSLVIVCLSMRFWNEEGILRYDCWFIASRSIATYLQRITAAYTLQRHEQRNRYGSSYRCMYLLPLNLDKCGRYVISVSQCKGLLNISF